MSRSGLRSEAALVLALVLCPATAGGSVAVPDGFLNHVVVSGLNLPNSMAFLPDGRLLFTEQRTGRVRMVVNWRIASTDPLLTVPDLNAIAWERGLQGIAVDPGWPARPYIYLCYTRTGNAIRVVRYTAAGDLEDPAGEHLSLGSPLLLFDDLPDAHANHNAGCLRFGPDGHLFLSLGDDQDACTARDSTSLRGAILRLKVSDLPPGGGGPVSRAQLTPDDNPLATTNANARLVYAYGLRNPWRFQIDPLSGTLFACDVGVMTYEEMNEVLPGDFLGWPWREGPEVIPVAGCPEPGGAGANAYKAPILALARGPELTSIVSAGPYQQVAGAPWNWPEDYCGTVGDVFYAEFFSGYLRRLKRSGGTWGPGPFALGQPNETDWASGMTAPVDFLVGPDGSLWWLSQSDVNGNVNTGSLNRILFIGGEADAPPPAEPGVAARLGCRPNPFTAAAELMFSLPAAARVRLSVFDPSGRELRRLADGVLGAGEHRLAWDGRDGDGRAAGAGLYFARLERGGAGEVVRLVRLR